jgi:hypothetical protein
MKSQSTCDWLFATYRISSSMGIPYGHDMAEACPEPVEGKTFKGRLGAALSGEAVSKCPVISVPFWW